MSAQQQVVTIDDISADNAPAIYVAGGLGQFFEAVKAEVTGERLKKHSASRRPAKLIRPTR